MRATSKNPVRIRARGLTASLAWAGAILAMSFAAGEAQSVSVVVPGTSNPYLAGMPNGSLCCSGDSAPAESPVQVTGLTLTPGLTLHFSTTGSVNFGGGVPTDPPDGGFVFTTTGSNGISGATWPVDALVGVFLDNNQPDLTPAPADLNFTSTSFTTLSPALKQVFFIGDGLTGNGSGTAQTFVVPAGATRLFLGTSDGFGWFNNTGSFTVTVGAAAPPPPKPTAARAPIPTLSLAMLVVLSLGLAGIAAAYLIRRA